MLLFLFLSICLCIFLYAYLVVVFSLLNNCLHSSVIILLLNEKNHFLQLCSSVFVPLDDSDENSEGIEVPKVLADLFESVIAAVFLDCGMNVETTWLVVYNLLKPTFG